MLDIGRPDMNFVEMARGMGVDGERALEKHYSSLTAKA